MKTQVSKLFDNKFITSLNLQIETIKKLDKDQKIPYKYIDMIKQVILNDKDIAKDFTIEFILQSIGLKTQNNTIFVSILKKIFDNLFLILQDLLSKDIFLRAELNAGIALAKTFTSKKEFIKFKKQIKSQIRSIISKVMYVLSSISREIIKNLTCTYDKTEFPSGYYDSATIVTDYGYPIVLNYINIKE